MFQIYKVINVSFLKNILFAIKTILQIKDIFLQQQQPPEQQKHFVRKTPIIKIINLLHY